MDVTTVRVIGWTGRSAQFARGLRAPPGFTLPAQTTATVIGIDRSTVFAQTCCSTVAPPSTRAIVDTGESGRIIQIALKLRF